MNEHSDCIVCGCKDNVLLRTGVRHAPEIEVRRCVGCNLVFLWPQPSEEALDEYYRAVYRQEDRHPPIRDRFSSDLAEARVRTARLLPILRPDFRLLEIGCGSGAFLDTVSPHVGYAAGVEPDLVARQWIVDELHHPVVEDITELTDRLGSYDVAVLLHVLEHIAQPAAFLQTVRELLRPNGTLVVELPSIDDALVGLYQVPAYLDFYYQKAHLWYFSAQTLRTILENAGFDATVQGVQRYDLSNHMRWMLTNEPGGQAHYSDVLLPCANAAYSDSLIVAGYSDTLWALAEPTMERT